MMKNQNNVKKGTSVHSEIFIDLINAKLNSKINLKHSFSQGTMEPENAKKMKSPNSRIDLIQDLTTDNVKDSQSTSVSVGQNSHSTIFNSSIITEEQLLIIQQQLKGHFNQCLNGQDFKYIFSNDTTSSGSGRQSKNKAKDLLDLQIMKKAASSFLCAITKLHQFLYLFEDPEIPLTHYPTAFQEITAYGALAAEALEHWGMHDVDSKMFVNRLFVTMRYQRTNVKNAR